MYIVTVVFVVADEHRKPFAESVARQATLSLEREPDCRRFDVSVSAEDPSRFFLYEIYDDESAFTEHLASEHFKDFDATVAQWVVEKTVQTWLPLEDAS